MIWRIRERAAFERLERHGRRIRVTAGVAGTGTTASRPSMWCTFLPDPAAMPPRVAFAMGRALGPAVVRNRLRRRVRAVLADQARRSSMPAGWYLIGAHAAAVELTFDLLAVELEELLAGVRLTVGAS